MQRTIYMTDDDRKTLTLRDVNQIFWWVMIIYVFRKCVTGEW